MALALEIGTREARAILKIHRSLVVHYAVEVDTTDRREVAAALRARRLPGRKVGDRWLFREEHVRKFAEIERPKGRPKGGRAA